MPKQRISVIERVKRLITAPLEDTVVEYNNNVISDFSGWRNKYFWGIEQSTLESNESIFAAITKLSGTMASMSIKLLKNYEKQSNDISKLLTRSPNNHMTPYSFISRVESIRNEKGNCYVWIERDKYLQPKQLHVLNSDSVTPARDDKLNDLYYIVRSGGNKLVLFHTEVLHFKHITAMNSEVGISPIDVLKNATEFDTAVRKFNLQEMQKTDAFVIKYGTTTTNEKRDQVTANIKQFIAENGGVLFHEPGAEVEPIDRKYVSEDVVAAENLTRQRIANAFGVPMALLNGEGLAMKSVEEINRFYVIHTIMPIVKQYEDEFNKKLLNEAQLEEGYYFKFNEQALLRGDIATQAEAYQKGTRNGWFVVNEIRAWHDLPPVEGGDVPMISGDLYPLDLPVDQRNPPKTIKGGDKDAKKDN